MTGQLLIEVAGSCIPWERLPFVPSRHIVVWALQSPAGLLRFPGPGAQPLLEFSSGIPQLSLMEKQEKASFCILDHSYQNKRSWGKANMTEAQAEMEKTAFYG